jgi:hypothetical protein
MLNEEFGLEGVKEAGLPACDALMGRSDTHTGFTLMCMDARGN